MQKFPILCLLFSLGSILPFAATAAAPELRAERKDQQVDIYVDDALFTSYTFAENQKYPYFYPVNGPESGESVTTESSEPYPHHHSLFFGCDKVNGGNYWQGPNDVGQIVSQGPTITKAQGAEVVVTDTCLWRVPGEGPVLRDTRTITVSAPAEGLRYIDFAITLEPMTDVRIEQNNHSLFAARVTSALSVDSGGTLVNAEGGTGEEGTFGVAAPWCAYYGTHAGVTEGLAILQSPRNPWYPAKWFTRDYGFFSPTPMYWLEEGHLDLPEGEAIEMQYRVIVHAGTAEEAGMAGLFSAYAEARTP